MKIGFKRIGSRLLCQGLDNHQLALAICLGMTVGAAPLVWGTSLLCVLLAFGFRVNQVAVQAANYLAWPLQILLLYPYFKGGMLLAGETRPISFGQLRRLLAEGPETFLAVLAWNNLWALMVWLLSVPLLAVTVYSISRFLVQNIRRSVAENRIEQS